MLYIRNIIFQTKCHSNLDWLSKMYFCFVLKIVNDIKNEKEIIVCDGSSSDYASTVANQWKSIFELN